MKMKRSAALALAVLLVLGALSGSAFADEKTDKEPQTITNEKDGAIYNDGDIVFNNEGIVYNNSGTVYNNSGTVYNNGGTAYNNGGTVFNNGGTVYNNDGTVYNNGGTVYSNGGTVVESDDGQTAAAAVEPRVLFADDYSDFVQLEGLDGNESGEGYVLTDGEECGITPKEGYTITKALTDEGELTKNRDGSYKLYGLDEDAHVTLSLMPDAPVFSVDSGTFGSGFKLELSAAEGAEIYYTTDGSEPEEDSERYNAPISVESDTVIKAVALAEKTEQSETASAAYAFPELTSPVFDPENEGYRKGEAKAIVVENSGDTDAVISAISLEGESPEAFILNTTKGATVPAGETDDSTWTVRPQEGLEKGAYSARLIVSFDSGDSTVLFISFKVK